MMKQVVRAKLDFTMNDHDNPSNKVDIKKGDTFPIMSVEEVAALNPMIGIMLAADDDTIAVDFGEGNAAFFSLTPDKNGRSVYDRFEVEAVQ